MTPSLTPAQIREAKAMWEDHFTTQEIADELKVPESLIYNGTPYRDTIPYGKERK